MWKRRKLGKTVKVLPNNIACHQESQIRTILGRFYITGVPCASSGLIPSFALSMYFQNIFTWSDFENCDSDHLPPKNFPPIVLATILSIWISVKVTYVQCILNTRARDSLKLGIIMFHLHSKPLIDSHLSRRQRCFLF